MAKENDLTSEDPRPFREVLCELNDGELHEDLSAAMQRLNIAVRETGKKGELTLTLKLKPNGNTFMVNADFKIKEPLKERGESLFFSTVDGNLVRTSPQSQRQMDLKRIEDAPQPLKRVG